MYKFVNFNNITSNLKKLNFKDLIIFVIPSIIFIYYLHVFNPGIMPYDSYNQLHQIAIGSFNNWHPFFHTFIEMICIKIYPSPVSVCILQIITFSTMWMVICKYFRRDNDKKLSKVFILQFLVTLIIALIPINAIHAITLYKDVLYSYNLMFLCFLIKVLVDKKGKVSYVFALIISLIMAFVAQIRPNGMYIILVFLIILFIYLFRKNKSNKLHTIIPVLTIVFILLISSLNIVYNVQDQPRDALMIKTSQILVDYDLNLDLADTDRNKIYELISKKDMKKFYNPQDTDKNFTLLNRRAWQDNKFTYLMIAMSYTLKNPIHYLNYLFYSAPVVWSVNIKSPIIQIPEIDHNFGREKFYAMVKQTPVTYYDNATLTNRGSSEFKSLSSFVKLMKKNKKFNIVVANPALYFYLSIICMLGIYLISKSKGIFFAYLPNFLNILIIMLSVSAQSIRFLYPNFLVFYLLVIILISELKKHNYIK